MAQNKERHDEIFGRYEPFSGYNCYDFEHRVHCHIEDFPGKDLWILPETFDNVMFRQVAECGSIAIYLATKAHVDVTQTNINAVVELMCQVRAKDDPEFALYITDKIQDKFSGEMIPFRLNYPQRRLLTLFEDIRRSGHAVRVIVLKARQWGGSTLTQLYMKWIQDYRRDGWNAIVVSQVKNTSKKIKAMYKKAIQHQDGWTVGHRGEKLHMSPYENSPDDFQICNDKEPIRRSILTVTAFEVVDNVRGENYHMAHYSEVAYWKQTPEHDPEAVISSISGGIHDQQDNVEVFESTGRGNAGFFYETWQEARDPDTPSAFHPIFIPFYIIEHDHKQLEGETEEEFAKWLLENRDNSLRPKGYRESGKFFWRLWKLGASFEAIHWYRTERNKYKSHESFATEAPVDEVEAFRSRGNLVFNPYSIAELRDECMKEPNYFAEITLKGDIGKKMLKESSISFRNDGIGELKIWALPNNQIMKVKNRYLVSVDIGGNSPNADYTVMTVIDRIGMIPGMNGKPAVVARYRGHCRHDRLAWKAAVLASYYDNAMLVIECNTADRERDSNTEGDHSGSILEVLADYYDNLYTRAPSSESVNEQPLRKFGFQTNRLTKQWLIDNLIAFVEDKLWEEPDAEMYHELSIYERREDGSLGNIKGRGSHDDVVMSTAIALWVSTNDIDRPDWIKINKQHHATAKRSLNEAAF